MEYHIVCVFGMRQLFWAYVLLCRFEKWPHSEHTAMLLYHTWPWASYQIRKIAGCACAGNAGNVFPRRRFQRKPIVGDPGMHHGTCVTHVPWCMSGSLTCGDGENVPGIPGACAPAILRIWQEAHVLLNSIRVKSILFGNSYDSWLRFLGSMLPNKQWDVMFAGPHWLT